MHASSEERERGIRVVCAVDNRTISLNDIHPGSTTFADVRSRLETLEIAPEKRVSETFEIACVGVETVEPGQLMSFTALFKDATSKHEMIVTFLALLELMKLNFFRVRQKVILGEIELQRNEQ